MTAIQQRSPCGLILQATVNPLQGFDYIFGAVIALRSDAEPVEPIATATVKISISITPSEEVVLC
jgi:hypothetical protein